jgi:hypothetical protein
LFLWRIILIEVAKMIIDADITVAYKCPFCGSFDFFCFSLFETKDREKIHEFKCGCGNSYVVMSRHAAKGFYISVPCIGCGGLHKHRIKSNILKSNGIKEYLCPITGMSQCFIGNDKGVRQKVDSLEREYDSIIDMLGYDNYFINNRVMLDSLNRIHDIAENSGLCCECGSKDIELALLPGSIELKCIKCNAHKLVKAASNEDIKNIYAKSRIVIRKECDAKDKLSFFAQP